MSTYRNLYEQGKEALEKAGIPEAALDARLLLEHICHTGRHDLLAHGERAVESEQEEAYLKKIALRQQRIPLQQITGEQEFMGLVFHVTKDVLIPRQDTEVLAEEVLRYLHDGMHILDLCTGSGCILISLLHYSNGCTGVGADISAKALQVAKENARRLLDGKTEETGTDCLDETALWVESNLFDGIEGKFDLIVSNPPYIETQVIETLMPEVREHEPRLALDGSEDGLFFYRHIIEESPGFLRRGGMLFFEIGYNQAESVSGLMREAGFRQVQTVKDFAGNDRVVFGSFTE